MNKISLVYMTYRPGGIDLLVESLKHQSNELYELIVVDDYDFRVERGKAASYIRAEGIDLRYYGKSKTKSNAYNQHGLSNAMNTGALWSTTNYIVFLHDFSWMPPGSIIEWLIQRIIHGPKTLISGIASTRNSNDPEIEDDITIWRNDREKSPTNIFEEAEEWVPTDFEIFYCGMPLHFLELINGIDERCDLGDITWPYFSIVAQAKMQGYKLVVERKLRLYMANHRKWKTKDARLWHGENLCRERVYPTIQWSQTSPNPYHFGGLRQLQTLIK